MKIDIDERSNEIVFFLEAENIEDAAKLLRLASAMKVPNGGYAGFHGKHITGWIKLPKHGRATTIIQSGERF